MLVDEYRPLFQGIEQADSVCIDAHKLLYCPMAMGLVLFRNERDLQTIRYTSQYVIRRNSVDTGRFTVEGSRPFACLKPWAALKIIGRDGYELLLRQAHKNTDTLKGMLDESENFETLNDPQLFILVYRFVPRVVKDQLERWTREKDSFGDKEKRKETERTIRKVNHLVNGLNIKLHKALRRDDSTFVSRTTLESTWYRPQSIVVLRAVLINPLTDGNVIAEIVETQNRIGLRLWKEFEPAYGKMLTERKGRK
jgi:glutamate decarboxylase